MSSIMHYQLFGSSTLQHVHRTTQQSRLTTIDESTGRAAFKELLLSYEDAASSGGYRYRKCREWIEQSTDNDDQSHCIQNDPIINMVLDKVSRHMPAFVAWSKVPLSRVYRAVAKGLVGIGLMRISLNGTVLDCILSFAHSLSLIFKTDERESILNIFQLPKKSIVRVPRPTTTVRDFEIMLISLNSAVIYRSAVSNDSSVSQAYRIYEKNVMTVVSLSDETEFQRRLGWCN